MELEWVRVLVLERSTGRAQVSCPTFIDNKKSIVMD